MADQAIYNRCKHLYNLLDKHLERLESDSDYQSHLRLEHERPAPSMDRLDPEIAEAVRLFNAIPGVATLFSCQGIRRSTQLNEWQHGLIWCPGYDMPLAHIAFTSLPPSLAQQLDQHLKRSDVGTCSARKAESNAPENNVTFVHALEQFARERVEKKDVFDDAG